MATNRPPPRFVPTLTEVVHSGPAPLAPTPGVSHEQLAQRVLQRVDLVLDRSAIPAWHWVRRTALRLRPIQQGRLYAYLIYVMVALVVLLAYLGLENRR